MKTRTYPLLLALALVTTPAMAAEPPAESPVAIGAGVVVIVAGGAAAIWLARKCAKWFPRGGVGPTNVLERATGEYGAAFFWSEEGYCPAERLLPVTPTVFTLDLYVDSVSNVILSASARVGSEYVMDLAEAQEELASRGMSFPEWPQLLESYEVNRQPAAEEDVPIRFDFETKTATLGSGGITVTVERSSDLREWETLVTINVAPETALRIADVSAERQFFRVRTR